MKDKRVTHGMYGTRIYRIWAAMKRRCQNKNYPEYSSYGGRGINVCDEWQSFESFYKWAIVNGYDENLTLDRINNDSDYTPTNCRWVNSKQQANNRRSNKVFLLEGQSKTLKEWCDFKGLNYKAVWKRINAGWAIEDAFSKPLKGVPNAD